MHVKTTHRTSCFTISIAKNSDNSQRSMAYTLVAPDVCVCGCVVCVCRVCWPPVVRSSVCVGKCRNMPPCRQIVISGCAYRRYVDLWTYMCEDKTRRNLQPIWYVGTSVCGDSLSWERNVRMNTIWPFSYQ